MPTCDKCTCHNVEGSEVCATCGSSSVGQKAVQDTGRLRLAKAFQPLPVETAVLVDVVVVDCPPRGIHMVCDCCTYQNARRAIKCAMCAAPLVKRADQDDKGAQTTIPVVPATRVDQLEEMKKLKQTSPKSKNSTRPSLSPCSPVSPKTRPHMGLRSDSKPQKHGVVWKQTYWTRTWNRRTISLIPNLSAPPSLLYWTEKLGVADMHLGHRPKGRFTVRGVREGGVTRTRINAHGSRGLVSLWLFHVTVVTSTAASEETLCLATDDAEERWKWVQAIRASLPSQACHLKDE